MLVITGATLQNESDDEEVVVKKEEGGKRREGVSRVSGVIAI